jgi:hypothetical protein
MGFKDAERRAVGHLRPVAVTRNVNQRGLAIGRRVEASDLVRLLEPQLVEPTLLDIRLPEPVVPEEAEPQRSTARQ